MEHSFDIEIATEYGIVEAILLKHFQYWIAKNEANRKNYYEGCYWTYNSTKAFSELFPYLTQRKIQNALKKLRDEDIIRVGNYNENQYDRTLWYAFTKKGECIMQKREMDNAKKGNGFTDSGNCINTDINTDNKTNEYIIEWNRLPSPIPKIQSIRGQRSTMLKARINEHGSENVLKAIKSINNSWFLKGKNDNGWVISFDWFIKPTNFVKVLEGNYIDHLKQGKLKSKPTYNLEEIKRQTDFNDDYDI